MGYIIQPANRLIVLIILVIYSIFTNFANANNLTNTKKIYILASFSILADIVANIGGDKIRVEAIVGANQDAHGYSLKPSDLNKFNNAQLIFINGIGLENGWIRGIINDKLYSKKIIVATNGINYNNEKIIDPHIWGDPTLIAKYYIPNILNGLIKIDPQNKLYYTNNADNYIKQLSILNQWINTQLNIIPIENRIATTTHDAFSYYAKAYKINFIYLQGVSTDSEASAKDVAKIISILRRNHTKVVFLENMTNSQLITQVANDSGAKVGGKLYSDALSAQNEPANSYINLMKYNTKTMVTAWQ